jgi:hypothetical protein
MIIKLLCRFERLNRFGAWFSAPAPRRRRSVAPLSPLFPMPRPQRPQSFVTFMPQPREGCQPLMGGEAKLRSRKPRVVISQ